MHHEYERVNGKIHNIKCEINVAEHCNLSCKGCSHLSPVLPKYFVDPADIATDLTVLARHYRVDVMRLLGGEPLLHPDLPAVIAAVRASQISDTVCLVTNGLLLPRMTSEVWEAVDRIEISMYPGHSINPVQRAEVESLAREHGVDLHPSVVDKFRQSYSELRNDDPKLVRRIYSSCTIVHQLRNHTVAHGTFYRCPQSYFIPKVVTPDLEGGTSDGLAISDDEGFGDRLFAFLNSSTPPAACTHCLGSAGHLFAHVQIRKRDFRQAQEHPPKEMFSRRQSHPSLAARVRRRLED